MAEFGFSEAQEMLRREAERFCQKEIIPGAKERDKKEEIPRELVRKMGESGLLGLNVPERYGGQPADWISVSVVVEELGKGDPLIALIPLFPILFSIALKDCSEEVRQEWLPALVKGEKIACFSLTEPDCGSDAGSLKTRAIRKGDYYIFNGEKTSITFGMMADVALVFAKTDPSAPRGRGVSCFLVPLDLPGITRSKFADMGLKAAGRASLMMDDVKVPAKYLASEEGKGFKMAMEHMNFLRIGVSLAPLALAETALNEAMNYARQRTAFGKPLAKFEGISYKLAETATLIETGKLLCYHAFWMMDQHMPNTKEVAMCKWWCPWVAAKVVHDCLLIFGHIGYSEEFAMERRLRDVIGFEMADGTADIMKLIIARELLGREFLPY